MSRPSQIQALVRYGLYHLTEHALEEALVDLFDIYDGEHGILTGKVRRTWPKEGTVEIVGRAVDERQIGAACRMTKSGKVRVITVYQDEA